MLSWYTLSSTHTHTYSHTGTHPNEVEQRAQRQHAEVPGTPRREESESLKCTEFTAAGVYVRAQLISH